MICPRRGGRGIAPTHLQAIQHYRRWVVSNMLQVLDPQEIPSTHCREGWVCLGVDQDGMENSAPTGIQSPDHPAHNKSLYQLCNAGCYLLQETTTNLKSILLRKLRQCWKMPSGQVVRQNIMRQIGLNSWCPQDRMQDKKTKYEYVQSALALFSAISDKQTFVPSPPSLGFLLH